MDSERALRYVIKDDFDRIANCGQPVWNHNIHYYPVILGQLPSTMERVLDIGCGNGDLVRLLAPRAARVEGIDLSAKMIVNARALSPETHYPQIVYQCGDIMETALDAQSYDAIISVATVHHLPMAELFVKIYTALKPGGLFVILDLYQPVTVSDLLLNIAAVPVNHILRRRYSHKENDNEAALWAEHGRHDRYAPIREILAQARTVFPHVDIHRLLLWRYLMVAQRDMR